MHRAVGLNGSHIFSVNWDKSVGHMEIVVRDKRPCCDPELHEYTDGASDKRPWGRAIFWASHA